MKVNFKSRRVKHGSVSVALTAVTVAAIVIINVILSVLSARYGLFFDMSAKRSYEVTEDCREYLEKYVISEMADDGNKMTFLFCDEKESIDDELTQKYIHDSALEIKDMFPDKIEIDYFNIYEQPSRAREYGVTSSSSVVVIYKDAFVALTLRDFYIFSASDSTTPLAYNGEKRLAAGMLRVVQKDTPMCYLTVNHGELVDDYELMYAIADAGYNFTYLDIFNHDIPDDCELLITFNPRQDLAAEGEMSSVSEADKIREYMSGGGKYMVFASADTFVSGGQKNFEQLLSEWGVEFMHSTGEDGTENCYNIKDPAHSTTTDGYTVFSEKASVGFGAQMLADMDKPCVFGNATSIGVSENYSADGNGNYRALVDGLTREMAPILLSYDTAEAWAGGRVVAEATDTPFSLMTMTRQTCENGETAYLVACASTEFASESAMQSVVFGNPSVFSSILKFMGKENVATSLTFKPFGETRIESITTSQSTAITVVLAVIPAIAVTAIGTVLLLKRKNK